MWDSVLKELAEPVKKILNSTDPVSDTDFKILQMAEYRLTRYTWDIKDGKELLKILLKKTYEKVNKTGDNLSK